MSSENAQCIPATNTVPSQFSHLDKDINIQIEQLISDNQNVTNNVLDTIKDKRCSFNIASINLNGLVDDNFKLKASMDIMNENNIDIMGILETNTSDRQMHFITRVPSISKGEDFRVIHFGKQKNKSKGSGTGIILKKQLVNHVFVQKTLIEGYLGVIGLGFKDTIIYIITMYCPPNNNKIYNRIYQQLQEWIKIYEASPKAHLIIIGDFNQTVTPFSDKFKHPNYRPKKTFRINRKNKNHGSRDIIHLLKSHNFTDTFRFCNGDIKEYTWTNGRVCTRIDHIWICHKMDNALISANVDHNSKSHINTDHSIIRTELNLAKIINRYRFNAIKRINNVREVFDFTNIDKEIWDNFADFLDDSLRTKTNIETILNNIRSYPKNDTKKKQKALKKVWEIFNAEVLLVAGVIFEKKKISTQANTRKKDKSKNSPVPLQVHLASLRKIVNNVSANKYNYHSIKSINHIIDELNSTYDFKIKHLNSVHTHEHKDNNKERRNWCSDTSFWLKALRQSIIKLTKANTQKDIITNTEKRCLNTFRNQKGLINSTLERSRINIQIDRLKTISENGCTHYITDEKEILDNVNDQFGNIFKPRKFDLSNASADWVNIYKPQDYIEEHTFDLINTEPTVEEWTTAASKMNVKSAAGPSGVTYKLIQHVGTYAKQILCKIVGTSFQEGFFPDQWKQSIMYPIPKKEDWGGDCTNTRPIILLDCFRKVAMRILTDRIKTICESKNVLRGLNYCGLSKESTTEPIFILNALMEDAHDNNRQCWVLLQDMKKAFDSISTEALRASLLRIKMNPQITNLLTDTFGNRSISIITAYGNSDPFMPKVGIDQGDIISPLIWRVFYDPLLCMINNQRKLGYEMNYHVNIDPFKGECQNIKLRLGGLAYADDSAWIGGSKDQLQEIMDTASEFYDINNIEINARKCDLLVVGKKERETEDRIEVKSSQEWINRIDNGNACRYLGVWIEEHPRYKNALTLLHADLLTFVEKLIHKKITLTQASYINNVVYVPLANYRIQHMSLTESQVDSLQAKMLTTIKHKGCLPRNIANNILFHEGIVNCSSLYQEYIGQTFDICIFMLNHWTIAKDVAWYRLNEALIKNLVFKNLDELNMNYVDLLSNTNHNFMGTTIKWMLSNGWTFAEHRSSELLKQGNIFDNKGEGLLITEFLKEITDQPNQNIFSSKKGRLIFNQLCRNGHIYFVEQLITREYGELTWARWPLFKNLTNSSTRKGKSPKWFNAITNLPIPDNINENLILKSILDYHHRNGTRTIQSILKDRRKKEIIAYMEDEQVNIGKVISKNKECQEIEVGPILLQNHKNIIDFSETTITLRNNQLENIADLSSYFKNNRIRDFQSIDRSMRIVNRSHKLLQNNQDSISTLQSSENSLEITVTVEHDNSYDSWIITDTIKENVTLQHLHQKALDKNKKFINDYPNEVLRVYTDGSLIIDKERSVSGISKHVGAGWWIEQNDNKLQCTTDSLPSSTRGELLAIASALLTIPFGQNVIIYSDSMAAIQGIKKFMSLDNRDSRKMMKETNFVLKNLIVYLLDRKKLVIEWVHVKSHTGNKGNDEADKLAKEAWNNNNSVMRWDVKQLIRSSLNIQVTTYWNSFHPNCSIRRFTKLFFKQYYQREYDLNTSQKDIKYGQWDLDENTHNFFLAMIRNSYYQSFKDNSFQGFVIKCINDILPEQERKMTCNQEKCSTVVDPNCHRCNGTKDTLNHIIRDTCYDREWIEVWETCIIKMQKRIKKRLDQDLDIQTIKCIMHPNYMCRMEYYYRMLLLKGHIPRDIVKKLKKLLKTSNSNIEYIVANFIKNIFGEFRHQIWNIRNKEIHDGHRCQVDKRNETRIKPKWTRTTSLYTKVEKRLEALKETVGKTIERLSSTAKDRSLFNVNRWKAGKDINTKNIDGDQGPSQDNPELP